MKIFICVNLTCKTANMTEKIVMISKQTATAMAVMAVSGEFNLITNSLLFPSLPSALDSASPPNEFPLPITVRRFPPVEVTLHPPKMKTNARF